MNRMLKKLAYRLFNNPVIHWVAYRLYQCAKFLGRKFGVRQRYVFTKNNNLRARYVAGFTVFVMAAILSFTLTAQKTDGINIKNPLMSLSPAAGTAQMDIQNGVVESDIARAQGKRFKLEDVVTPTTFVEKPKPIPLDRKITIQSGDALGVVMERQGIGNSDTSEIIEVMKKHFDPRHIKAGQKIDLRFEEGIDQQPVFREMEMVLDPVRTLVVARAGDSFVSRLHKKELKKVVKAKQAEVKISLYGSAAQAGIPKSVVAEAIQIFSWNVDFQRDIRPSDTLEVMYESFETDTGHVSKIGDILYTKLTLGKREIPLYRYKMYDGRVDYFQPDGRSIKRTLMKTPINGARMSSGFGKRRHPVLGYTKMHKGVDFAAPTGTPIFAAGDGVVEKAGWFSSFGKYIRIRHNSKLKTAYAHLNKIKPAVKVGARVKQGQVIGHVGTTGRSTGPHLHYEVMVHGKQVNPRSVNLPTGEELTGSEMAKFRTVVDKMRRQYALNLKDNKLASRQVEQ